MSVLVSVHRKSSYARMPTFIEGSTSTYTLYCAYPYNFLPRESQHVATDLKIIIPPGYCGIISQCARQARGWPFKVIGSSIIKANDNMYVTVELYNIESKYMKLGRGAPIAYLTIIPCFAVRMVEEEIIFPIHKEDFDMMDETGVGDCYPTTSYEQHVEDDNLLRNSKRLKIE